MRVENSLPCVSSCPYKTPLFLRVSARPVGYSVKLSFARMILSDVLHCTVPPLRVQLSLLKHPTLPNLRRARAMSRRLLLLLACLLVGTSAQATKSPSAKGKPVGKPAGKSPSASAVGKVRCQPAHRSAAHEPATTADRSCAVAVAPRHADLVLRGAQPPPPPPLPELPLHAEP